MKKKLVTVELIEDNLFVNAARGELQLTKAEAKQLIKELQPHLKTENKYKNDKVEKYGITWDSKIELEFYEHLCSKYGYDAVIVQPSFTLQEKVYIGKNNPKNMHAINYVADFMIKDTNLVYDVKGYTTADFLLKFKMFKSKFPDMVLSLITKCPRWLQDVHGDWVDLSVLKKARIAKKKLTAKTK